MKCLKQARFLKRADLGGGGGTPSLPNELSGLTDGARKRVLGIPGREHVI